MKSGLPDSPRSRAQFDLTGRIEDAAILVGSRTLDGTASSPTAGGPTLNGRRCAARQFLAAEIAFSK